MGGLQRQELRRPYLTLLLTSAKDPVVTAVPTAIAELTAEISANLTWETVGDLHVSLPLAQHLLRMASLQEKCPDSVWQELVTKVDKINAKAWKEGVAAQAAKLRNGKDFLPSAKKRLDGVIRTFAGAHPDSALLLRAAISTHEDGSPERLVKEDCLLALPEAVAKDFTDAAYKAAKAKDAARAKAIFQQAEARFPADKSIARIAGWSFIHLGDGPAMLAAFQRSRALLKRGEQAGVDLLVGLSIAQWLNNQQEAAITTYLQLIETGRKEKTPKDWADPKTVAALKWPAAEAKPMEAVRSATLKKHPQAVTKPEEQEKPE